MAEGRGEPDEGGGQVLDGGGGAGGPRHLPAGRLQHRLGGRGRVPLQGAGRGGGQDREEQGHAQCPGWVHI